jgi:hypothetical protein
MKEPDLAPSFFCFWGNHVNELLFYIAAVKPAQAMHAASPALRGENSADNPIFSAQDTHPRASSNPQRTPPPVRLRHGYIEAVAGVHDQLTQI